MPEPSTFSQTLIGMQREIDDLKRRLQANIPRGAGGSSTTIVSVQSEAYIIYIDGTTVKAVNGLTGAVDFSYG